MVKAIGDVDYNHADKNKSKFIDNLNEQDISKKKVKCHSEIKNNFRLSDKVSQRKFSFIKDKAQDGFIKKGGAAIYLESTDPSVRDSY